MRIFLSKGCYEVLRHKIFRLPGGRVVVAPAHLCEMCDAALSKTTKSTFLCKLLSLKLQAGLLSSGFGLANFLTPTKPKNVFARY